MHKYTAKEILDSEDFRILKEQLYKPVAWGYTKKALVLNKEFLVAERIKADDPLRIGELILPGGGKRKEESYMDTARRETLEEGGVKTKRVVEYDFFVKLIEHNSSLFKPREKHRAGVKNHRMDNFFILLGTSTRSFISAK